MNRVIVILIVILVFVQIINVLSKKLENHALLLKIVTNFQLVQIANVFNIKMLMKHVQKMILQSHMESVLN